MIVRSPRPEDHFSTFSNEIIRDTRLSYKARGILLDLLSRPDNWRVSAKMLAANGVDGRDAIMSGLKELRDLGYIVTQRSQDDKGLWSTESVVYDTPRTAFPSSVEPSSENPVVIEEPKKNNLRRIGNDSKESPKMDSQGLEIKTLIQMYFDNFTGQLEPSRGQLAGQLQQAIKQIPFDKLQPLVVRVALDGQTISRNTLIYAQNKLQDKRQQPTPTPPKFDPAEYERPDAKVMPQSIAEIMRQSLAK